MKKLIILRGVPGSGKSTYAKNLVKYLTDVGFTAVSFEADTFSMIKMETIIGILIY